MVFVFLKLSDPRNVAKEALGGDGSTTVLPSSPSGASLCHEEACAVKKGVHKSSQRVLPAGLELSMEDRDIYFYKIM